MKSWIAFWKAPLMRAMRASSSASASWPRRWRRKGAGKPMRGGQADERGHRFREIPALPGNGGARAGPGQGRAGGRLGGGSDRTGLPAGSGVRHPHARHRVPVGRRGFGLPRPAGAPDAARGDPPAPSRSPTDNGASATSTCRTARRVARGPPAPPPVRAADDDTPPRRAHSGRRMASVRGAIRHRRPPHVRIAAQMHIPAAVRRVVAGRPGSRPSMRRNEFGTNSNFPDCVGSPPRNFSGYCAGSGNGSGRSLSRPSANQRISTGSLTPSGSGGIT